MNKSAVILLGLVWILCTLYYTIARLNNYPYRVPAMIGSWVASFLLLIGIIIFVRKHKSR